MEREGFFRRIHHRIVEKAVPLFDKDARRKTVLTIVEARNGGEEPDEEILHHFSHVPGDSVKEILTGQGQKSKL